MSYYGSSPSRDSRSNPWKIFGITMACLWAAPLVITYAILWPIYNWGFSGYEATRDFNLGLWSFWHGAELWLIIVILLLISTGVAVWLWVDYRLTALLALGLSALTVAAIVYPYSVTLWDNDKDYGRYYAGSTVFYTDDPAQGVPDSLKLLADGASAGEGCDLLGKHDVRGCIRKGKLSAEGWDARVSSYEGAKIAIRRNTEGVQRVSLKDETVTYLNASGDTPAMWSGVLDGSGREQSLYGVAEWTGTGKPSVCRFEGKYDLTRAFDGDRGNSLPNMLADRFPTMRWDIGDVWGYCDGDKPVVVVPMTKPVLWMDRTVDTAAGIVLVEGDNGNLKLTHQATVKAGDYRGPVYPGTMVAEQRNQAKWAAGRKNHEKYSFGYDPSEAEVQASNNAEYLLRDAKTGRLVFVTPLTLRSSTSEVFVAYSVTYADEVRDGNLNELSVYVLKRDDSRAVNLDTMVANANAWLTDNYGTFRANGGRLIELTPVNGDMWRVFGENNGKVVFQLDISSTNNTLTKLVKLNDDGTVKSETSNEDSPSQPSPEGVTTSRCAADLSQLDNTALAQCLDSVTGEVQKRLAGQN